MPQFPHHRPREGAPQVTGTPVPILGRNVTP
jgi:hypothetical protein